MPPPLRVLHALHDYLPRHQAGSEIYVAHLCAAQRRMGVQPTVLAAEFDPARAHGQLTWKSHDGVPVAEVVNTWQFDSFEGSYRDPSLTTAFGHVLDIVQPHVLHVHNLLNLSFELPALARARGIAVAATLHDYTLVCPSGGQRVHRAESHVCHVIEPSRCARCFPQSPFHAQLGLGRLARRAPVQVLGALASAMRKLAPRTTTAAGTVLGRTGGAQVSVTAIEQRLAEARKAFANFDVAVAPSASLASEFAALGFPVARVVVSDYGFPPLPRQPRAAAPEGRLRVGFVGTLVWHKGADVLIDAVGRLPGQRMDVTIFGDPGVFPEYAATLRQRARGLPVRFAGRFDRDRAEAIFAQMDVLVVASRWLENSPLVIHEAFMAGVPVVGTAIGGIVDLLDHGRRGVLVPPDDPDALAAALGALMDEPSRLEAMRRTARDVKSIDQDAEEWSHRYAAIIAAADSATVDAW
jgi:glycosyltransferase involved in cell wall biosynthesis